MSINLHIERLVLDGLTLHTYQKAELKTVVESELKRLLVLKGINSEVQSAHGLRVVSGGSIDVENTSQSTSLGRQIGNAVYRGIGK